MTTKSNLPPRPPRPTVDPLYLQVVDLLSQDKRGRGGLSQASGLSQSTLRNWEKGTVRCPQSVSLQMALRALNKRLVIE